LPPTSALTRRCFHEFGARERARGSSYRCEGRVGIGGVRGREARGVVRGSGERLYFVSLRVVEGGDDPLVEAGCTCPRFESGHPCKHLWAFLEELDRTPRGFEIPGDGPVVLLPESEYDEDELLEPDEEWPFGDPLGPDDASGDEEGDPEATAPRASGPGRPPLPPAWIERLRAERPAPALAERREIYYVISPEQAAESGRLELRLVQREWKRSGGPGRLKALTVRESELASFPEPDASALAALLPCAADSYFAYRSGAGVHAFSIARGLRPLLLPLLARTGRLCAAPLLVGQGVASDAPLVALRWDGEVPYAVDLRLEAAEACAGFRLVCELGGETPLPVAELRGVLAPDLAFARDRIVRLTPPGSEDLVDGFRAHGPIEVEPAGLAALLERIAALGLAPLELPEALGWREEVGAPQPQLAIAKPTALTPETLLFAKVAFAYGGARFSQGDPRSGAADAEARRIVRRDPAREAERLAELRELGFAPLARYRRGEADLQLSRRRMPELVRELLARGWQVEAEGVRIRRPGAARLHVASGIDWFDLEGAVDFEGESVPFPELLAALERGETSVALADGSLGMLPEAWLARVAPLAELGRRENGAIRFLPSQAVLLGALLAEQPQVEVDELFRRTCERLESAGRPVPSDPPPGFRGVLREYQREGLGWLRYLRELGLGGCLADDMGLGKTVQVLALLAGRRARRQAEPGRPEEPRRREEPGDPRRPSLVVVPRSLVHNWLAEAVRFAPELRVLDYTGLEREPLRERFGEFDAIVTTYGTLRRDAHKLAELRFDTVVLDEAQTIKNAGAQTSKAARALRAEHRLALSGTPVENHLGELWAIFDFLNPGMLGPSARRTKTLDRAGEAAVAALARALGPFLLRRTKEQVLRELPAKTEQTLLCALEGTQKRLYEELRRHYRESLLRRVDAEGIARSRMHVLEALLRLRQAACHPGLVDRKRRAEPSAKLDVLLARLEETLAEGHKAVVFSQFTSLLAIVRERLRARGLAHEYLDGRTRRRAEAVARFQGDPELRLFLVSLRAGGQGLNLTAADYVFLLDPWWNPAVEAQAIDRAHRIGQTRPVFAYRIVAEATIEEKILLLQERKRRLADAIVSADRALFRDLTREDLELLLG
jgi:superfamily II DNA or RNA helicase